LKPPLSSQRYLNDTACWKNPAQVILGDIFVLLECSARRQGTEA